jgi:hypothetical protein
MVFDAMAAIATESGQLGAAQKALDEAAQLHSKLHHTGTGQANAHIARGVQFQLRKGDPIQAAQELSAFMFKPPVSGKVTRPQLERTVMQAEVALALHHWDECLAAAMEVHEAIERQPLPEYVRDLQARAWQVQGLAQKALGKTLDSKASLREAAVIHEAMRTL